MKKLFSAIIFTLILSVAAITPSSVNHNGQINAAIEPEW